MTENLPPFVPYRPIKRLFRQCRITEKIDGTNGVVYVSDEGSVHAGSRSGWLVGRDNYGFAQWVQTNSHDLATMGPGYHFGEWWGQGIQRKYGLSEKRFSLFHNEKGITLPACVSVVPTLFEGPFSTDAVHTALELLRAGGSAAAPGFMNPEGVVAWLEAPRVLLKATFGDDGLDTSKK